MKIRKLLYVLGLSCISTSLLFGWRWIGLLGHLLILVGAVVLTLWLAPPPEPTLTLLNLNAPAPSSPPPSPR